jgi:hypothetical protein
MVARTKRDIIVQTISEHKPTTIGQLAALIKEEQSIDEDTFIETINEMVKDKSLILDEPQYPIHSFLDYLFTINISSWFWVTITIIALTALLATSGSDILPVDLLRWCFGSLFLLFLPGYSCLQLLLPKDSEINRSQRLVFSIPTSLSIVILVGFSLNYSPLGIRLDSLLVSISAITLLLTIPAAFRAYLRIKV